MPVPRRRPKEYTGGLSRSEAHYFRWGRVAILDGPPRFYSPATGIDHAAARALWDEYGDPTPDGAGYIPWAAIEYDGATGEYDPYAHLRAPKDPA